MFVKCIKMRILCKESKFMDAEIIRTGKSVVIIVFLPTHFAQGRNWSPETLIKTWLSQSRKSGLMILIAFSTMSIDSFLHVVIILLLF